MIAASVTEGGLSSEVVIAIIAGCVALATGLLAFLKDKGPRLMTRLTELEERQSDLDKINKAQWYYITVLQHWGSNSNEPTPRLVPPPPPLLTGDND